MLIFSLNHAFAYDNPAGSTDSDVNTSDAVISNAGTVTSAGGVAINSNGSGVVVTNSGSLIGGSHGFVNAGGDVTSFNNSGLIQSLNDTAVGNGFWTPGSFGTLTNTASGQIIGSGIGVWNNSPMTSLINSGLIEGTATTGIMMYVSPIADILNNAGGVITGRNAIEINGGGLSNLLVNSIINEGSITGTNGDAILISFLGSVQNLTNSGTISSTGGYGINNGGTIGILNNAQADLTYTGNLPSNYNIVLGGNANTFGKLAVTNPNYSDGLSALTTFGILSGPVKSNRYVGVLSGVPEQYLSSGRSGTYGGYSWSLDLQSNSLDIWDLVFATLGPSTADTVASLALSANRLRGIYSLQSTALVNGLSYDCQVFDKNNICLSTGGRYSVNSGAYGNTTSALLIGAYRLNKNVRIGAWVDQNLSTNTGTGVNLGNSKPLFGVFGAWSENPTAEGYEVKVSAGYGDKDLTVTRDVIGTSEAGVGNSRLNSQAISSVSSYGFRLNNQLLASPYVGIRYSKITSNGYTEASSDTVTTPLTYNRLSQENVALMAGLKLSAKLDPKTTFVASVGIEQNLKNRSGQYSATGVDGLTPIEFNSNPQKTRATALLGAYYDIDKTQRVGLNATHRQEAFQSTATTSALATYTVGF